MALVVSVVILLALLCLEKGFLISDSIVLTANHARAECELWKQLEGLDEGIISGRMLSG